MLFTSFNFFIFFVAVFLLYWFLGKGRGQIQNIILFVASYVFYGIADWRMIPLLLVATVAFYFLGIAIEKADDKKSSALTTLGVVLGVGMLLYFKYFNFFIQSFSDLFNSFGLHTNWHTFKIILPLGLSYYTFKLISYVVEIHRGKMGTCHDWLVFADYVAFFPTITAGPIDRPNIFIPQIEKTRVFDYSYAVDGCRQILWGLFKKIVIADSLSSTIDSLWNDSSGVNLVIAALLYTFQMYNDFSGYSDMAIGIGKLLGLRIAKNFNYPFFATNISEFWRRWHISLTGWLTDYVFMPLNIKFRNLGYFGIILAIIINMVLVGMWHGANWTYAVFGLYQGLLFIPIILSGNLGKKQKLKLNRFGMPKVLDALKMFGIVMLYTIGAIMFRSDSVSSAFSFFERIFTYSSVIIDQNMIVTSLFIVLVIVIEWIQRNKEHGLCIEGKGIFRHGWVRFILYLVIILVTLSFAGEEQQFIYFQY